VSLNPHVKRAADGRDPVAQSLKPGARAELGAADAVIADLDGEVPVDPLTVTQAWLARAYFVTLVSQTVKYAAASIESGSRSVGSSSCNSTGTVAR
jgi:hypothetical protein